MENGLPPRPLEFRLASRYRRGASYVWFACLALATVQGEAAWAGGFRAEGRLGGRVIHGLLLLSATGLLIWSRRRRVRSDEQGVARRHLIRWERWPWSAFEGGRIDEGIHRFAYCWTDSPRGCRRMTFESVERTERELLVAVIRRRGARPPLPPLPAELSIRWSHRRRARFSAEGIWLGHRSEERWYPRSDVRHLRIHRLRSERRDFVSLELSLPDEVIRSRSVFDPHRGEYVPRWRGADAAVIAATLHSFTPRGRVEETALRGTPEGLAEVDDRLADLVRRRRGWGWGIWYDRAMSIVSFGGLLIFYLMDSDGFHPKHPHPSGVYYVFFMLIALSAVEFLRREAESSIESERGELESCRSSLLGAGRAA